MTTPVTNQHLGRADFTDQLGFFNPASVSGVTMIGLGTIGASALAALQTIGVNSITAYEDDDVEPRNLASQLIYRPKDLWLPKLSRAEEYFLDYGGEQFIGINRLFTADDEITTPVVVSGVDTMTARQEIWKAVERSDADIYFDGRIGAQHMTLLTVEPFDGDWYKNRWLFDDKDAVPLPCGRRNVAYPAMALAAVLAAQLARWSRGEKMPKRIDFDLGSNFFQTVGTIAST